MGILCLDINLLCSTSCPFYFCNHLILPGKRELVAFLCLPCGCKCYGCLSHGAMGWFAVCDLVFSGHTHLLFGHHI